MNWFFTRIRNFFVAEDEAVNALIGADAATPAAGNPHYTLSQRWGFECLGGSTSACRKCRILTWIQNHIGVWFGAQKVADHCAEAIKGITPTTMPSEDA